MSANRYPDTCSYETFAVMVQTAAVALHIVGGESASFSPPVNEFSEIPIK